MPRPNYHSYGTLKLTALEWSQIIGIDKRTVNRLIHEGLSIEQVCEKYKVDPFADDQAESSTLLHHIEASFALSRRKAIRRLYYDLKENIPHYLSSEFKGLKVA